MKNGVSHSSLIRPVAKFLVSSSRSEFWFFDDPDSDKWIDYILNGENFTNYGDKLVFLKIVVM